MYSRSWRRTTSVASKGSEFTLPRMQRVSGVAKKPIFRAILPFPDGQSGQNGASPNATA
jgi:hypothetical protein